MQSSIYNFSVLPSDSCSAGTLHCSWCIKLSLSVQPFILSSTGLKNIHWNYQLNNQCYIVPFNWKDIAAINILETERRIFQFYIKNWGKKRKKAKGNIIPDKRCIIHILNVIYCPSWQISFHHNLFLSPAVLLRIDIVKKLPLK